MCGSPPASSSFWNWALFLKSCCRNPPGIRRQRSLPMKPESVTEVFDTSTLLRTLIAFRDGDFSTRLPVDQTGVAGKIADTLNDIFKLNQRMAREFARISSAVGKEGKINQRATLGAASGEWAECLESV